MYLRPPDSALMGFVVKTIKNEAWRLVARRAEPHRAAPAEDLRKEPVAA